MRERVISNISFLINTFSFLILGMILVAAPIKYFNIFHLFVSLSSIFLGIVSMTYHIIKKDNISKLGVATILFIMGIYFLNNRSKFLSIFPLLFGIYISLNGIIKLVTFIVYKKRKCHGFYRMLLSAILDFLLSYIIIVDVTESVKSFAYFLGYYFILIAINYFIDFIEENSPKNFLVKRRRFRITLPIIFSLFIPYRFYTKIAKQLDKEITEVDIGKKTGDKKVDLEIFIAVKDSSIGKFGHADLCFEDKIYSYGHYDEDSKRLFDTIGDGVIFTVDDRLKYLKFCAAHSKKTIFAFGISLTDKQKERVRKELDKIMGYTYRWECKQELDNTKTYGDYASCLYRKTKAKFYKFSSTNYRLYFALWGNCIKLVDNVLGATGSDILRLNGVITPGTYYHFLNNEFKKKNSNVIRKQIITNKEIIRRNKNHK